MLKIMDANLANPARIKDIAAAAGLSRSKIFLSRNAALNDRGLLYACHGHSAYYRIEARPRHFRVGNASSTCHDLFLRWRIPRVVRET
jgi:hypothetical protein